MALPGVTELRDYLRIEHFEDDTLLTLLLARARGAVEAFLDCPVEAEERTFVLEAPSRPLAGLSGAPQYGQLKLRVPIAPIAAAPALVLTDADETVISTDDYRLDRAIGLIRAVHGIAFGNFPYGVVATVGLATRGDYETVVEPVVGAAMIDLASDLYQRRSPAAQAEGAGGGVYTQWRGLGLPDRVKELLQPFKRITI